MNPPGPYPPYPPNPGYPPPPRPQSEIDDEHLQTLAVGYLIIGILEIVFSSFAIFHFTFGLIAVLHPSAITSGSSGPLPPWFGWLFLLMGGAFLFGGWSLGITTLIARRFLIQRRHYTFLLALAGVSCVLIMPIGTVLGVFTFILLLRPSVRALFPK